MEEFAAELAALCPGDLDLVYPLGSGSEAVEAALKLARQYWVESGQRAGARFYPSCRVTTATPSWPFSFCPRPLHDLFPGVAGRRSPRAGPLRLPLRLPGKPPLCPACSGDALEEVILREGPDTIAAFIGEPVGGSSTGATVPAPEYWRRVREICDRHGVLFVADEVLTGAGRTGTWSALEPYGVVPDIMTLGKGIAAGTVPLSAVVVPRRIVDVLAHGSGSLLHAQTFSHHPVLCAAGLATLRYLREHRLVERCPAWVECSINDSRCCGSFHSSATCADGDSLPASSSSPIRRAGSRSRVRPEWRRHLPRPPEAGLVVWPNVGHADGTNGDLAMLAPPFIVTEEQIEEIVSLFTRALKKRPPIVSERPDDCRRQDHLYLHLGRSRGVSSPLR